MTDLGAKLDRDESTEKLHFCILQRKVTVLNLITALARFPSIQSCRFGSITYIYIRPFLKFSTHPISLLELGYNDSESYGVSYKVRGLCEDESNLDIMDTVSVWGEITDSVLAYNFHGAYFYGHQAGLIQNNSVSWPRTSRTLPVLHEEKYGERLPGAPFRADATR